MKDVWQGPKYATLNPSAFQIFSVLLLILNPSFRLCDTSIPFLNSKIKWKKNIEVYVYGLCKQRRKYANSFWLKASLKEKGYKNHTLRHITSRQVTINNSCNCKSHFLVITKSPTYLNKALTNVWPFVTTRYYSLKPVDVEWEKIYLKWHKNFKFFLLKHLSRNVECTLP